MEDPTAGAENLFAPPGGSIFATLTGKDGPPMARMIIIQAVCEMAGKAKMLGPKLKILIVLMISLGFIGNEFKQFVQQRGPNIYKQIGLERSATLEEIQEAQAQYEACLAFEPECKDKKKRGRIYRTEEETVREIFYVLKKGNLREIYDKTEQFVRQK